MKTLQAKTDKLAIGFSLACAIHCLTVPTLLVLLPSLTVLQLDNEAFHFWMVAAVIPTSIYALTLGCREHKRYRIVVLGGIGLAFLISALLLGEEPIGELGEQVLTVIGSGLIVTGHWQNYRLCRSNHDQYDCACPAENSTNK